MASDDLASAEAQWREQFAAMQAALADLKLPVDPQPHDGDVTDEELEGYSSADGGQDVWDFISEEDDEGDRVLHTARLGTGSRDSQIAIAKDVSDLLHFLVSGLCIVIDSMLIQD